VQKYLDWILTDAGQKIVEESGYVPLPKKVGGRHGRLYTILIVTHNMAQARGASDECIFMLLGEILEQSRTEDLFLTPAHPKTAEYIEGRYG